MIGDGATDLEVSEAILNRNLHLPSFCLNPQDESVARAVYCISLNEVFIQWDTICRS